MMKLLTLQLARAKSDAKLDELRLELLGISEAKHGCQTEDKESDSTRDVLRSIRYRDPDRASNRSHIVLGLSWIGLFILMLVVMAWLSH